MRSKHIADYLLFLFPSRRGERTAKRTGSGNGIGMALAPAWKGRGRRTRPEAIRSQTFQSQTFPHVDALFADAFCLTGSRDDAADLVVEAYLRAFRDFDRAPGPGVFGTPRTRDTLAWLYRFLHAAFCDGVLARTAPHQRPTDEAQTNEPLTHETPTGG